MSDEPDGLGEQVARFFEEAAALAEVDPEGHNHDAYFALARRLGDLNGQGPPPTPFAAIVTFASEMAGAAQEAEDDPTLTDISIGAWWAMTRDPRFGAATGTSRAVTWNNLAEGLRRRFARLEDRATLDEAIACQHRAVEALEAGTPNIRDYFGKLSLLYRMRGEAFGDQHDLSESFDLLSRWVARLRAADPLYADGVNELAIAACALQCAEPLKATVRAIDEYLRARPQEARGRGLRIRRVTCLRIKAETLQSIDAA